jgi:hypothetical protein
VSAPTLWEEGRWSGTRVTRFSAFASVLLVVLDLIVSGGLGRIFDVGFVLLCLGIALAIAPDEFFSVGVLPPMLLLGVCAALTVLHRSAIASSGDGLVQSVVSGLAHHSVALLIAHGGLLAVLAVRHRVVRRRDAEAAVTYSNREVSPAPYLVISGDPEVKSTTVVGSEPHSPVSMTASSS